MKRIGIAVLLGAAGLGFWGCAHAPVGAPTGVSAAADRAGGVPELAAVYGVERPERSDAVILRDGRRITGELQNRSLTLMTAYGRVAVSRSLLAGADLRMNAYGLRSLTTVNRDRFSGFLEDQTLTVRQDGGAVLRLDSGEVSKLILGRRLSPVAGIDRNQYFVLRNGDVFSGRLAGQALSLRTTFGSVPVKIGETEYIQFGGATGLVTVVSLNKEKMSGFGDSGLLQVDLDVGGSVSVERDMMFTLYCRKGFLPRAKGEKPATVEAAKPEQSAVEPAVPAVAPRKESVPVLDLEAPAAPAQTVSFPEGMRTGGTRHTNRRANISFENCPRDIGTAYGGVTFSSGWYAWEPPNPDYKLNGKVATSDGEAKITFANPCSTFELLGTSPQVDTEVVALDASGGVVARATFSGVDKLISLRSSRADISTVEVRGEPNQWVIDDIVYR